MKNTLLSIFMTDIVINNAASTRLITWVCAFGLLIGNPELPVVELAWPEQSRRVETTVNVIYSFLAFVAYLFVIMPLKHQGTKTHQSYLPEWFHLLEKFGVSVIWWHIYSFYCN